MYLNRFVSSRYQSLVYLDRPKICRFRLIVSQVQVVLELWRITLDQWLIPIIIGNEHVLVVKVLHGLVLLLTKFCYTELLLQYQNIGNATETLTPVAETIYHAQHVLLPYSFSGSPEMVFICFD